MKPIMKESADDGESYKSRSYGEWPAEVGISNDLNPADFREEVDRTDRTLRKLTEATD